MPSVISYTPPWLSRPSPGFDVFSSGASKKHTNGNETTATTGPRRIIAARGSEIFLAIGNEIRWSDLVFLKETWETPDAELVQRTVRDEDDDSDSTPRESESPRNTVYRILKVPISQIIKQLVISPQGEYLAILTTHTVHIAVLPDSSHLASRDTSPLRLKTFQLGPTTHVLDQAPVVSALWHPLGMSGNCVVTVTADAVVRLWELDRGNRWSFDNPSLAADLRKLVDCVFMDDDFTPSKYGTNKGYSPDSLEMEASGACFGGRDYEGDNGWASMTLWVAMKEGDIYALCPILPSKWQPSPSLISTLSASIVEKVTCAEDPEIVLIEASQNRHLQYTWISDIDNQDLISSGNSSIFNQRSIYRRPTQPGPIPRLQGPFVPEPYPGGDFTITDIFALAGSADSDRDSANDGSSTANVEGGSVNVICLATSDSKVHVCLDLDGIEGQWLSNTSKKSQIPDDEEKSLLLVETIDLQQTSDTTQASWPTFTPDVQSTFSVFVTHSAGVSYLSLNSWIQAIEDELYSTVESGITFRVGTIIESIKTTIEHPIQLPHTQLEQQKSPIPAVLALEDSDLGYFLLTTNATGQPIAATLSSPSLLLLAPPPLFTQITLPTPEPRPTYQPPSEFYASSTLPHFLDRHLQGRARPLRILQDPLRLSPATLELMMEAHRVLTHETHTLGAAAAELFRRCERLRDELWEQVRRVDSVAARVDALVGDDIDFGDDENSDANVATASDAYGDSSRPEAPDEALTPGAAAQSRLEKCRVRQTSLATRYDNLRRKLSRSMEGRALNRREEEWAREVAAMKANVLSESGKTAERFTQVESLKQELVDLREEDEGEDEARKRASSTSLSQPASNEIKRAMAAEIHAMLEREAALVDATRTKLDRLKVAS